MTAGTRWPSGRLAVTARRGAADCDELLRRCAEGGALAHAPASVSASVRHHAAVVVALNAFHRQLAFERKTVPFPREELETHRRAERP